jgi:DNA polymerase-4
MAHYKAESQKIFAIFRSFTPLVEGLSLDEAFLDVTASRRLFGTGPEIARRIKRDILEQTQLTASVGVAENKLVAKIASDLDKPDGLAVVTSRNVQATLDPLPVSVIPGIGEKTLDKLHHLNIRTVADLRLAPARDLESVFGRYADRTRDRAAGLDDRPVVAEREEKSVSAEETFDADLTDRTDMERELRALSGHYDQAARAAASL